jgi:ribosomal protein S18 acetylase RimI-like enzyme
MSQLEFQKIDNSTGSHPRFTDEAIAQFLYQHLGKYGDPLEDISKCINYAMGRGGKAGGFIMLCILNNEIVGAVVMNRTGMEGYIPPFILVYIAVDASQRGQGIGGKLMEMCLVEAASPVALHVEPDNPAKQLYERLGFSSKYLEMRYTKE